ncbi:hypothetical protein GOBAR_DD33147 [Gossypium barbadense]|nr:hypothetical protein GOBAR_DD33147 [Gossypium barbadense]
MPQPFLPHAREKAPEAATNFTPRSNESVGKSKLSYRIPLLEQSGFNSVTTTFPSSSKAADELLKAQPGFRTIGFPQSCIIINKPSPSIVKFPLRP